MCEAPWSACGLTPPLPCASNEAEAGSTRSSSHLEAIPRRRRAARTPRCFAHLFLRGQQRAPMRLGNSRIYPPAVRKCRNSSAGQLAARPERASEQARRKRQQAAALQIRPDRHYPVILPLWDFDVPLEARLSLDVRTLSDGGSSLPFSRPQTQSIFRAAPTCSKSLSLVTRVDFRA